MVSNHVMDLIERYGWDSDIPSELTDFVKARKFYDYKDHSRVGAAHGEFVTDEICDRFCVIGSAEECTKKLRELEAVGVDQFNIYLMTNGQEETLQPTAARSSRSSRASPGSRRERPFCVPTLGGAAFPRAIDATAEDARGNNDVPVCNFSDRRSPSGPRGVRAAGGARAGPGWSPMSRADGGR